MASLEKRGQSFRIVFRYDGVKYAGALSTRREKSAHAALARLEDNLHRLELGKLVAPDGGELAEFLLGDVRVSRPLAKVDAPLPIASAPLTLAALFASFWAQCPENSLEQSTVTGMKIHQRQLENLFSQGLSPAVADVDPAAKLRRTTIS